ncbi:hypothetical protein M758_1G150300 [Ceratodon purpureus]|uniref:Uncharacterized protein n=1 Tax=Ceratodon purpureus TaxID=3225 RepID=A0A8T0J5H8_CERPU|nr:hypothetical protein KC19_1G153300 [Ceratodon purpureus]KAG0630045.1 hypothetical protein M758_1G150300 [Ceratodon purpureus]
MRTYFRSARVRNPEHNAFFQETTFKSLLEVDCSMNTEHLFVVSRCYVSIHCNLNIIWFGGGHMYGNPAGALSDGHFRVFLLKKF